LLDEIRGREGDGLGGIFNPNGVKYDSPGQRPGSNGK
jgi:hypothetical protein